MKKTLRVVDCHLSDAIEPVKLDQQMRMGYIVTDRDLLFLYINLPY